MRYVLVFITVPLTMGVIFGLVNFLVELIITLVAGGGVVFLFYIINKEDLSLGDSLLLALAVGVVSGLLCIPLLPFYEAKQKLKKEKIIVKENRS